MENPKHRYLHGISRGCARVLVGGEGSSAIETDHSDQTGRTAAAAKAAASHMGALTGHEVLDAAFRRCGVVRVNTIAELFYLSSSRQAATPTLSEADNRHKRRGNRGPGYRRVIG